jgi:hypothetical protein
MTLSAQRIRDLLFQRPLGGLSRPVRQGFAVLVVAALVLFVLPWTHDWGRALMVLCLCVPLLEYRYAPEREITIVEGRLYLRTREESGHGICSADIASIDRLRLVGAMDARRLHLRMSDASSRTLALRPGKGRQREVASFLASSPLADRLESAPPPSWMDELRGYDE